MEPVAPAGSEVNCVTVYIPTSATLFVDTFILLPVSINFEVRAPPFSRTLPKVIGPHPGEILIEYVP